MGRGRIGLIGLMEVGASGGPVSGSVAARQALWLDRAWGGVCEPTPLTLLLFKGKINK